MARDPVVEIIEQARTDERNRALEDAARLAQGWVKSKGPRAQSVEAKIQHGAARGVAKDIAEGIRRLKVPTQK